LTLLIWYILTPSTTPDYTPIEFNTRTIDSINHKINPLPKDINVPNKANTPLPPRANNNVPVQADPQPTRPSFQDGYLSEAELVAENTLPTHLNSLFRDGSSASDTSILNTAIAYFSEREYSSAIQTLKQIPSRSLQYESAQEWLAYSYFYAKNFTAAAPFFEQLIKANYGRPFTESAEWFLILCLTDQYGQHKTRVNSMLQNIIDQPSHRYHEQALQLQQRLAQ
jgi:tetratricopeptide (TPR) repeat protein